LDFYIFCSYWQGRNGFLIIAIVMLLNSKCQDNIQEMFCIYFYHCIFFSKISSFGACHGLPARATTRCDSVRQIADNLFDYFVQLFADFGRAALREP